MLLVSFVVFKKHVRKTRFHRGFANEVFSIGVIRDEKFTVNR